MIEMFQWFIAFSIVTAVGGVILANVILWVRKQEEKRLKNEGE